MTDKDLNAKILKWLEGQGYGLEMKVAAALGVAGFDLAQSTYYEDPQTGVSREIDVVGRMTDIHMIGLLSVYPVVECKKSAKPWVLFTSESVGFNRILSFAIMNEVAIEAVTENLSRLVEEVDWFRKDGRLAYGATEAFSAGKDAVFQAATQVTKASIAHLRQTGGDRLLSFFFPTIVLDGRLFECYLGSEGEPIVAEVDSAFLNFPVQIGGHHGASVRIVTFQALDTYCKDIASVYHSLAEHLRDSMVEQAVSMGMPSEALSKYFP